ncbi:MAG: zinc-binding dehydrogenase [Chloroflexi bacterium]|nr:zinc-binding dehydrogenase [Chloroflexota bacterium]
MGYKRVIITEFGGPEVLKVVEEAALPEPGPSEVRVKVLVTSACFTDTMVRKGSYIEVKDKPPFSPGYDIVGVVDKLGAGVTQIKVGQRVAGLTIIGAYSEYVCLSESRLVLVPDELDPAEAVSLILSYVTAYQMLHRSAQIQRGQRILVHGAGGAVGTALLQLGKLLDLEMYGTASKSKQELVTSLGATHIDYKSEDFVRRLADDGVDAAFDAVSGDNFKRSFSVLKPGGTLVAYGFYDVAMGKASSLSVMLGFMRVSLLWNILPNGRSSTFYSITQMRKKQADWFNEDLSELFNLLEQDKIKPVIAERMPLAEAARAHALVERAAVKGRIVLMVNE